MWRQRGGLQVGEGSFDRLVPHAVERGAERPLRAHQHRARDQQLGGVHVDRRLRRTERCRCPAPHHVVVADDDHVCGVQPAVGDPGGAQLADLAPELPEQLVAHRVRRPILERPDVGLARDDQRVAVRAQGGGDDPRRRDSGLRGHQGGQCLMLDLFQPARPARCAAGRGRRASGIAASTAGCPVHPGRGRAPSADRPDSDEPTYSVEPIRCRAAIRSSRTPTPSSTSARRTASAVGTPSDEPNATRTRMPAVRPSAMLPRALDGSAAPITTAPSPASADRQATSFRAGATSSGPATVNTATTTATLSSGNPQLENTPVSTATQSESTSAAENRAEDADDQHDCDKVTGERPSPVPHDVDDDHRSRDQRRGEDDSPERRRPVQELAQRHRRAGVRLGCRGRHQCDQSGRDREGREKDRVDGATVPAGRVCVDQQRKARGLTRRWHSLSRHAHPSASSDGVVRCDKRPGLVQRYQLRPGLLRIRPVCETPPPHLVPHGAA